MSFKNKVILVTGGSSGIGAAIAIKFATEGAKVAIVGRNKDKLKQVSQKCEQIGSKPLVIKADISKDNDVKRLVIDTISHYGKLDILINNAGIMDNTSILTDNVIEVFDKVMATNMRSVVNITNLAVKYLIESKGNIINISSIAAKGIIIDENFAYCASKAALDHFTKCIALELAPKGVRVNTINPGPVRTDILGKSEPDINKEMQEMIWSATAKNIPLRRVSDPEEIADLVLFLASEKAKSITGSTIVSDNGVLLTGLMQLPKLQ